MSSRKKIFQLCYQVTAESLVNVVSLAFELIENTGMEPKNIALPDGRKLEWNSLLARQFVSTDIITEKEFIEMTIEK